MCAAGFTGQDCTQGKTVDEILMFWMVFLCVGKNILYIVARRLVSRLLSFNYLYAQHVGCVNGKERRGSTPINFGLIYAAKIKTKIDTLCKAQTRKMTPYSWEGETLRDDPNYRPFLFRLDGHLCVAVLADNI